MDHARRLGMIALFSWLSQLVLLAGQAPDTPQRVQPSDAERAQITQGIESLGARLKAFDAAHTQADPRARDLFADAAVWHKAAVWALRHGEFFDGKDAAAILDGLARGASRLDQLELGRHNWTTSPGGSGRGFRSRIDGSYQPYALYVPPELPEEGRVRLDVVLHGRGATLNESRFLRSHDGKPYPEGETGLVLHVFGRGNNAYRWAGETDVFEAIEAVKRNYPVDERRVVLRGFSMGGAGAWHLGLHHPSTWCAVEVGAGFAESVVYARLRDLPESQEKALRIYDAADYALNAFNLPVAGYGGEEDPQRRASELIQERLQPLGFPMRTEGLITKGEGIDFLRVVGAKVGHKVDPESAKVLKEFRDERAARGLDATPEEVRFVTYTLKYPRASWVAVGALGEHYQAARVTAWVEDDTAIVSQADNVAVLAIDRQVAQKARIQGQVFPLRDAAKGLLPWVYYRRGAEGWELLDFDASRRFEDNVAREKRPGLQGPIDDAFTGRFLCVRGTGTPWSPAVQAWADERLKQFAAAWDEFLRGELPIKDDFDVTPEDAEGTHVVLFGDPGSNRVLARLVGDLPLKWTRTDVSLGGTTRPSDSTVPVLIAPNPSDPLRYVVVNGTHTFGRREFLGTNALLFPKLGDFALVRAEDGQVVTSGYFDERWRGR
jgi:hypothetical protein